MKNKVFLYIFLMMLFSSCGNVLFRDVTGVFEASFETNGGTLISSFETTKIEESPKTYQEDYYFDGWYKQSSLSDKVSFPYTLTENTKFYAKWLPTYSVSFETNGGSTIYKVKSAKIEESPISQKENCILYGWYTTADCSGEAITFPYDVNEDITLYAKWIQTYKVTFETNGGSNISSYRTAIINNSPTSNKDDFSFIGWYEDSSFSNKINFPLILSKDITLYAKWQKKHLVNFDTQGGNRLTSIYTGFLEETEIPVKENKDFSGWYLDSECTDMQKITLPYIVEADVSLYAKWNAQQCSVTFYSNGADSGTPPLSQSVDKGSEYTIPSNSGNLKKSGYAFTKWNTKPDGKGKSYSVGQTVTVSENLVLYAQWGKDYSVLLPVTGGTFIMGKSFSNTNNAYPMHSVTVSDFSLAQYELTYELWFEVYSWAKVNGYTISPAKKGGTTKDANTAYEPAMEISWCNAVAWCNAYSEYKGLRPCYYTNSSYTEIYKVGTDFLLDIYWDATANGYRLPTEAEWEYAAGGGENNRTTYSGTSSSSILSEYAWTNGNANSETHPVGSLKPNILGFYDMTGNAMEWCFSTMYSYSSDPETDPRIGKIYPYTYNAAYKENCVVCRGGSYQYSPYEIQYRHSLTQGTFVYDTGIRIAKNGD